MRQRRIETQARIEAVDAWWEFRRRLPPPRDGNWQKGMAAWIDRHYPEASVRRLLREGAGK